MESKGKPSSAMDTENFAMVSPGFSDILNSSGGAGATSAINIFPFSSCFDISADFSDSGKSSLGFMDLLGAHQDLGPNNSLFDFPLDYVEGRGPQLDHQLQYSTHAAPETPDTVTGNPPATPNTSSISSSSNEALADEQQPKRAPDDDDQDDSTTKKVSKPKKKKQKREKVPRFAFMTKSEVDHLEDGYRWRKYGQKAVKNSPFPRSYYRCTTAMCGVKKRVERSCEDPTIVVTTYEGQHTHHSPAGPRGSTAGLPIYHSHPMSFATGSATAAAGAFSLPSTSQQQALLPGLPHHSYLLNLPPSMTFSNSTSPGFCGTSTACLFRDHGLLQDMVNPDAKRE